MFAISSDIFLDILGDSELSHVVRADSCVTAPVCFLEWFRGGGAPRTLVTDSEVPMSWIFEGA